MTTAGSRPVRGRAQRPPAGNRAGAPQADERGVMGGLRAAWQAQTARLARWRRRNGVFLPRPRLPGIDPPGVGLVRRAQQPGRGGGLAGHRSLRLLDRDVPVGRQRHGERRARSRGCKPHAASTADRRTRRTSRLPRRPSPHRPAKPTATPEPPPPPAPATSTPLLATATSTPVLATATSTRPPRPPPRRFVRRRRPSDSSWRPPMRSGRRQPHQCRLRGRRAQETGSPAPAPAAAGSPTIPAGSAGVAAAGTAAPAVPARQ
jgi:hypothetical protein